jgi:DNA adenine methylase
LTIEVSSKGQSLARDPSGGTSESIRPFLRWAGGKRWLLPRLRGWTSGVERKRHIEPFLGGGSVLLGLGPAPAVVSDANAELIATYKSVRSQPREIAASLQYKKHDSDSYYEVRASPSDDPLIAAAQFIYLNHTSFNGIYRVNRLGKYNVPFGNRASPQIPTAEHLQLVAERLQGTELICQDFADTLAGVQKGDFVFLDPPYAIDHPETGFVKYNSSVYNFDDQQRLRSSIDHILSTGAAFVLTNASHASIEDLFSGIGTKELLSRGSAIGGRAAKRGRSDELVYTNIGEA